MSYINFVQMYYKNRGVCQEKSVIYYEHPLKFSMILRKGIFFLTTHSFSENYYQGLQ